ncbi:TraR/DksA C4-type zinc finger protein [Clostridium sp. cel8]|jgi:YteA family regulatory protein|uniref:TraR/DksA C4-type zinc finger protein n=1 Tax=Clostridium sp. cel8 TaxID=2663123 RepID=UPI0015F63EF7|nr:TraR/DksA C4-type zinc finger protein [Clostridium sp. cel8]MBA5850215.1 TraR/DksA C4-type zinc finger protein [Clostridium sp. cel8]
MDNNLLRKFKNKLELERDKAYNLLNQMEKNETIKSNSEMFGELSSYDNHPADNASSVYDKERGLAFEKNEIILLEKVDRALKSIDEGTYGICKMCGRKIDVERLKCMPYAEYCVECQKHIDDFKPEERKNRPPEEDVIGDTFNKGYGVYKNQVEFDIEDGYQSVGKFNRRKNIVEEYVDEGEEYVEPIEKISNSQYKNQLP